MIAEEQTLAAVEALVDETLASLDAQWLELAAPVKPRPGVLHTDSILDLYRALVRSGGKKIRPRMVHWGWAAAGAPPDGHRHVVRAAAALELLHAFALIHDDVMDESASRRGHPSVHAAAAEQHRSRGASGAAARYGESIAILVGDLAHEEACALAMDLPAPMRRLWRTLSVELMLGQGRDLVGAANRRRDLEHAREVARVKSGAYTISRPLQLGAAAAGASERTVAVLLAFGEHLGLAFALRDDLLGVFGDPGQTGKPVGDDLVAGKPTVLFALATASFPESPTNGNPRLTRSGLLHLEAGDVPAVQRRLRESGVIDRVEGMIAESVAAAKAALEDTAVEPRAASALGALADRIAWRSA